MYRRADTEVDDGVFLYFHKDKWRVGDEIGRERTGTKLCNESSKQRKSNPPIHNWQEISHGLVKNSWQDCDLQLESEVDLSTCHLHVKLKTGKEKKVKGLGDKEEKVIGTYSQLIGRWSLGRRVSHIFFYFIEMPGDVFRFTKARSISCWSPMKTKALLARDGKFKTNCMVVQRTSL